MHTYICVMYALGAGIAGLSLLMHFAVGALILCLVIAALSFAHSKTGNALERNKSWAPAASGLLALPVLFVFPIGTALGAYLLFNIVNMETPKAG